MTRLRAESGFALVWTLAITALAVLAATSCIGLALAEQKVVAADSDGARALAAAELGVQDAVARLRWGFIDLSRGPATVGPVAVPDGEYFVRIATLDDAAQIAARTVTLHLLTDPRFATIEARGTRGTAVKMVRVVVALTPDALPRGVVATGDIVVRATLSAAGCGVYAGGDVRGREHIVFTSSPADENGGEGPADHAYPRLYAVVAAHARGGIYLDGYEEHAASAGIVGDTDRHAGEQPSADLVAAPGAGAVGAWSAHSSPLGGALTGDGLRLDVLPAFAPGPGEGETLPPGGRVYAVPAPADGGETAISGRWGSGAAGCPAAVIVLGDCIVTPGDGTAGEGPSSLTGALVVTGTLRVEAPLTVAGGLYARRLVVDAPLTVRVFSSGGQESPPGMSNVLVAAWDE